MAQVLQYFSWALIYLAGKVIACPSKCNCEERLVFCRGKGLTIFPNNVPAETMLLDLRDNFIWRLSKSDLEGLEHLEVLLISHNRMQFIDEDVLDGVPRLRKLYASRNKLEALPTSWSKKVCYLEYLDVHGNRIGEINNYFTKSLPYLRDLNLADNNIQTFAETAFKGSHLQVISIESNPINCDCRLQKVQSFLRTKLGKEEGATCYYPKRLRKRSLFSLDEKNLQCHKAIPVSSGKLLQLTCSVKEHPVVWLYRQRHLDDEYNGEYEIFANGTIAVETNENPENFQCAINYYWTPKRKRRQLRVPSRPRFLVQPKDRLYREGTAVRIVCEAVGYPRPHIKWFFDEKQLNESRIYKLNDKRTALIINPFLDNNVGRYKCVAENSYGWIESSATIGIIPSSPPQIVEAPRFVVAVEGSLVMLRCIAKGQPKPTITWAFDGNIIPIVKGHVRTSADGTTLTLDNISRKDHGTYTCLAGNTVGSMTAEAQLAVARAPEMQPVETDDFENIMKKPSLKTQYFPDELLNANGPEEKTILTSPEELLKWFQFARIRTEKFNKTREIYEESIRLIRKHIEKGLTLATNGTSKQVSFETFLAQSHIAALVQLSGCTVTQIKDSCEDQCYHSRYRSFDGQCNNQNRTTWGASYTPFRRLLPPIYENGFNAPVGWNPNRLYFGFPKPNPREISKKLFRTSIITPHENYSSMVMQWGQFIDHDIDFTAQAVGRHAFESGALCNNTCQHSNPCFNIKLPHGDPKIWNRHNHPCIEFERSSPVCGSGETSLIYGQVTHREQMNTLTSYIDGSNIYGSTDKDAIELQDLENNQGFLRYDILSEARKPFLPFDTESVMDCKRNQTIPNSVRCFLAGDLRANEQLGLLSMHTIFMRQHNHVVVKFSQQNTRLDGQTIFQETRKIVAAQIQHITYHHWLPKILGKEIYEKMIGKYKGYKPDVDASVSNAFATAAFRFGHSLINPFLYRYDKNFKPFWKGHIPLHEAFFSPETIITDGIDPILRGLFATPMKKPFSKQLLNEDLTEKLFHQAHEVALDLAAINIQRGRDHGLPGYVEYRKWCNLSEIKSWKDLKGEMSQDIIMKLHDLYGHPGNVDLFAGGMAETRKNDSLIGPTFACIIADQFRRLRDGDRFWYEKDGVFTKEQLNELKKISLARILCDNSDDIDLVQEDVFLHLGHNIKKYSECKLLPNMDFTPWRRCCYRHCSVRDNRYILNEKYTYFS